MSIRLRPVSFFMISVNDRVHRADSLSSWLEQHSEGEYDMMFTHFNVMCANIH
jgi:hypothetical protein